MKQRGFTMVELMVTVGVLALLTALAAPTLRGVIENGRIRSAGQSLQNGLALARGEAVRRNTRVQFVIANRGWQVVQVDTGAVLQQSDGRDVPAGLTLAMTPAAADRITYNNFGRSMALNPDATLPVSAINIVSANPSGLSSYRPLRLQLVSGGVPRLCDPAVASTEPKACR